MSVLDFVREGQALVARDVDGELLAEITFPETETGEWDVDHTFVSPRLRGQGVADRLVRALLELARSEGKCLIATCPYVRVWSERHPETADIWTSKADAQE
ncbi:MAG: GNAT family N-acetyltransferase [Bacillota bacterium]|nr:GNAT family N-acetyltransferase [Bacillota bacterium]